MKELSTSTNKAKAKDGWSGLRPSVREAPSSTPSGDLKSLLGLLSFLSSFECLKKTRKAERAERAEQASGALMERKGKHWVK